MSEHKWAKIAEVSILAPPHSSISMIRQDWNVCENCGIPEFTKTRELPCPPWSSEEKKEERSESVELLQYCVDEVYEALAQVDGLEVVHQLKALKLRRTLTPIKNRLENIIQKLEAQK